MRTLILGASLACSVVLAAPKPLPKGQASNEAVDLSATLHLGKEAVKQVIGSDLDGYYVVVDVRLAPNGKAIAVSRDDFLLRTDKDGEKSTPFVASQIAGRGVLVVSEGGASGGMLAEDQGPAWGGYPGGPMGRMPGQGGSIGTGPGGGTSTAATVDSGTRKKENPIMQVLKEKILEEKETTEPVSGLLYFPLEGKQKAKDLELIYTTPAGKLSVRFR
jgi:hypothetical protein